MEYPLNALVTAGRFPGSGHVSWNKEEWHLARGAYRELEIAGMPSANLLLTGTPGTIRILMELLWLELREPVRIRASRRRPSTSRLTALWERWCSTTFTSSPMRISIWLLAWLDVSNGETRVVSTTSVPLWRQVKAGAFNDGL